MFTHADGTCLMRPNELRMYLCIGAGNLCETVLQKIKEGGGLEEISEYLEKELVQSNNNHNG